MITALLVGGTILIGIIAALAAGEGPDPPHHTPSPYPPPPRPRPPSASPVRRPPPVRAPSLPSGPHRFRVNEYGEIERESKRGDAP